MIPPAAPLRAVSLTHVRYREGDRAGQFLAWISLLPAFIGLGGFLPHLLFRRDLHAALFGVGLLLAEVVVEVLKLCVRQERPESCALVEFCDSHGWPSSHAQYMTFFAVYLTLGARGKGVVALSWTLAVLTFYSRVYLGYHTLNQVISGAVLGVTLGVSWFRIVNSRLVTYFPKVEESAMGKLFYLKDSSHIPDILKFEYDNIRAARKKAKKSAQE